MKNWHFLKQQPWLNEFFREPPIVSYKRGRSLKDIVKLRSELYSIRALCVRENTCSTHTNTVYTTYTVYT